MPDAELDSGTVAAAAGTSTLEGFENDYRSFYGFIFAVVTRKFRIPDADAEAITQEVFLSYLAQPQAILNARAWLVAVACNMSRHYWRVRRRSESIFSELDDDAAAAETGPESMITRRHVEQVLDAVGDQSGEVLRLHYLEGYSAPEIASRLETTPRYAEKMIHRALKKARATEVKES